MFVNFPNKRKGKRKISQTPTLDISDVDDDTGIHIKIKDPKTKKTKTKKGLLTKPKKPKKPKQKKVESIDVKFHLPLHIPKTKLKKGTHIISMDLGTVNFGLCYLTIHKNTKTNIDFTVHDWRTLQICCSKLTVTDTVHMMTDAWVHLFGSLDTVPEVDFILIERQHVINRPTDFSGHALMALFKTWNNNNKNKNKNKNVPVHMPDGGLKLNFVRSVFGAKLQKKCPRSNYAAQHTYNKVLAREGTRMLLDKNKYKHLLNQFEITKKKDDMADALLQALAFHKFFVNEELEDPADIARMKNNWFLEQAKLPKEERLISKTTKKTKKKTKRKTTKKGTKRKRKSLKPNNKNDKNDKKRKTKHIPFMTVVRHK